MTIKKRALLLTSDKKRHQYYASQISKVFELVGIIREPKKNYYESQSSESPLVQKHLLDLQHAENIMDHTNTSISECPVLEVNRDQINTQSTLEWAIELNPDVVFLFGTGILKGLWLNHFSKRIINIHLGLAPKYKGSATLFWPFYNDDLDHLGTTIHLAAEKVDSGDILKTFKFYDLFPNLLNSNLNYYESTNQLIKKSLEQAPQVVLDYLNGFITPYKQESYLNSLAYKKADFTELKLLKVLNKYSVTDNK
jgi:methionyl-tRNA formyltransferase